MGNLAEIVAEAERLGLLWHHVDLDAQFRCGGSEAYLTWVRRLLGLEPGGPVAWEGDERFELRVAESPEELEALLAVKASEGYGARMTAGYCWPWSDPRADGTLVDDVVIGAWARPWNVKGDRAVGGKPPSPLWATDPAGFDQVGCIYTAQGFEYDWSGVIFGPDLVWRGGAWVVDQSASHDSAGVRRAKPHEAAALVRNTYKVLLTRGMVGTVVFSTDPETQDLLRSLVTGVRTAARAGATGAR